MYFRWRVMEYWLIRVHGTLNILEKLDLIGRTCELARVFGILFFEVISRGSQFRVESLMLRLTKRKNMLAVSPNVEVSNYEARHNTSVHNCVHSAIGADEGTRVHRAGDGAAVPVLRRSGHRPRLPEPLPVNHHRVQLLLLNMSRASSEPWRKRSIRVRMHKA